MPVNIEAIIQHLKLVPHPEEGGFYRETYRALEKIQPNALPERYADERCQGTAIYYLLTTETFSHFHRLQSDEIFHFYSGDPVEMVQLYPDGTGEIFILGNDILNGENPQLVVPRGTWQGSMVKQGGAYALLGATVSPGFEFSDYEHASQEELLQKYPNFSNQINLLTRN